MKPLDRLREQCKIVASLRMEDTVHIQITRYLAMRLFCLDCELVSFEDIEVMEDEVNSSF